MEFLSTKNTVSSFLSAKSVIHPTNLVQINKDLTENKKNIYQFCDKCNCETNHCMNDDSVICVICNMSYKLVIK